MSTSGQYSLLALARRRPKPLLLIAAATVVILASLVALHWSVVTSLRETALKAAEGMTARRGAALVEQADRAIQSVDFVLLSLVENVVGAGVTNSSTYTQKMGSHEVHRLMREKMEHVPQLDAVTMVNADGKLINFSRYWPIPDVNVSDRDYFKVLRDDRSRHTFIGVPVRNRGDGSWNVYLARRITGRDGEFIGLVLGAMSLSYFEEVYRSVLPGSGMGVGLYRTDGIAIALVPVGNFADTAPPSPVPEQNAIIREHSSDGNLRIKVVQWLRDYPLFVLTTQTEASAFALWQGLNNLWFGSLIAGGVLFVAVALAVALWHMSQQRAAEAERARAAAEAELLREQERHAEAANNAKSAFLAMMSHEIRTPMHALLGLASTLMETRLDPAQREAVAAMQDSGDTLLRILNDVLDFSKLEAGKFTFENLPFSPHLLTDNILSIIRPRAQAKGLAVRFTHDPGVPEALTGDAGRIRQVLLNLLSNAVKFTEHGSITVSLHLVDRQEETACIEWAVADTGIGITTERVPTLFNDFVQADGTISRRFGGTGLGLAICKRIVDQMNGAIEVESTTGAGAIFRFRLSLPLAAAPLFEPAANPTAVSDFHKLIASFGRPLRILIAEDNATNQLVAAKMLEEFNMRIDIASDGCEAVNAATQSAFDLILMDVCMPEMDGLQATRAIRAKGGRLGQVPIIAMTANAFADDVTACRAAGMTGFVPKPTRKQFLVEAFVTALRGSSDMRPAAPAAAAAGDPAAEPVFDEAAFVELCEAIGEDGAEQTLAVFIRETRRRLVRLRAFSPGGEHASIKGEAHTLKGASGSLGFRRLAAHARVLEMAAKQPLTDGDLATAVDALEAAFAAALEAVSGRRGSLDERRLAAVVKG